MWARAAATPASVERFNVWVSFGWGFLRLLESRVSDLGSAISGDWRVACKFAGNAATCVAFEERWARKKPKWFAYVNTESEIPAYCLKVFAALVASAEERLSGSSPGKNNEQALLGGSIYDVQLQPTRKRSSIWSHSLPLSHYRSVSHKTSKVGPRSGFRSTTSPDWETLKETFCHDQDALRQVQGQNRVIADPVLCESFPHLFRVALDYHFVYF